MRELLIILIMSATPIIEQRGAIPYGLLSTNIDPFVVFLVSYVGSLLPVPFILLLFNKIFDILGRFKYFRWFYNFIQRKLDKNRGKFEKYEELALIIFIAIPLPTTGVWTGTAVASFLNLDKKKSFVCAAVGAFISAVVITIVFTFFPSMLKYLLIH
ncbi:COG2426 family protein [Oceanirhabdus sp. W0125-5]|uniref:COG2426 family protein n=1 Tax=Oceanirhabdus sp. W0125-5 TaxID=2999116 RepID=UPI0022F2F93B|nr:small multi-drug export protein [Oceanirhabdus sp. W0125-5]WBW99272.1 small multi-drug export protein [Oceanirhabdus sp. W0125-5]